MLWGVRKRPLSKKVASHATFERPQFHFFQNKFKHYLPKSNINNFVYVLRWLILFNFCFLIINFYYASIRLLSPWRAFSGYFFEIGSAISQCGTTLWLSNITPDGREAWVVERNTKRKWDNKRNFKNHIIGCIITSKEFLSVKTGK